MHSFKPIPLMVILTLFSLAAYFIYNLSNTQLIEQQPKETSLVESMESAIQEPAVNTNRISEIPENNDSKLKCDAEFFSDSLNFATPKWVEFKNSIYLQGISYPVLQLALSVEKPLKDQHILKQPVEKIKKTRKPRRLGKLSEKEQKIFIGVLLSEGLQAVFNRVDSGELPVEVFAESGDSLFRALLFFASDSNSNNSLPSEEDLLLLINHGLEITLAEYNEATKASVPVEFLELLLAYGPSPETVNNRFEEIPLDIAAAKGNIELMEFWFKTNLLYNTKLHGGNFNDVLLLNAGNSEQLIKYWNFLTGWQQFPRDPKTAQKLLSSKNLFIEGEFKQWLLELANEKNIRIQLSPTNQLLHDSAVEQIITINQQIKDKHSEFSHCFFDSEENPPLNFRQKEWLLSQLQLGNSLDEIMQQLTPLEVDKFRLNREQGFYEPLLLPIKKNNGGFKNKTIQKAFGLILLKDWDAFNQLIENEPANDELLIEIIGESSSLKLPPQLTEKLFGQIQTLPINSYDRIADKFTVNRLENMNLTTETLNRVDALQKNLFYYAAVKNNTEMMKWLVMQNVDMVTDPYGSDALDALLKYNTHVESLETICSLGFPINSRHRKRFEEIKNEDPLEADEILSHCSGFGE